MGPALAVRLVERCQSYRESNKGSKERLGPTLPVRLIEVSVKRESTVQLWHRIPRLATNSLKPNYQDLNGNILSKTFKMYINRHFKLHIPHKEMSLGYFLLFIYLFIYLFSHSQNLTQHEQKVLIKL